MATKTQSPNGSDQTDFLRDFKLLHFGPTAFSCLRPVPITMSVPIARVRFPAARNPASVFECVDRHFRNFAMVLFRVLDLLCFEKTHFSFHLFFLFLFFLFVFSFRFAFRFFLFLLHFSCVHASFMFTRFHISHRLRFSFCFFFFFGPCRSTPPCGFQKSMSDDNKSPKSHKGLAICVHVFALPLFIVR